MSSLINRVALVTGGTYGVERGLARALELAPHGVAVVSLYPGLVRTEKVMEAAAWLDLTNSESPDFVGRAVAALAADPNVLAFTRSRIA